MHELKRKIISLWLHFWLKRIAFKYPKFFITLLTDLDISKRQMLIMQCRYIDRLSFKQIPDVKGVNCELRHVMREHKTVIDKLINL